jgi:type II secretory pathway pseudopilin PulG
MEARSAPEPRARPRPISEFDPAEKRRHHGRYPPPAAGSPWGIFFVVAILLIIILAVVALRGFGGSSAGSPGPKVIVSVGTSWKLASQQYKAVRFVTNSNCTVSGNFTASTSANPVNVLLMNPVQYYAFRNNTTQPTSLNATDGVYVGGFGWSLHAAGVYYLVAWNWDPHHSTTVTWVTDVQWYS